MKDVDLVDRKMQPMDAGKRNCIEKVCSTETKMVERTRRKITALSLLMQKPMRANEHVSIVTKQRSGT